MCQACNLTNPILIFTFAFDFDLQGGGGSTFGWGSLVKWTTTDGGTSICQVSHITVLYVMDRFNEHEIYNDD